MVASVADCEVLAVPVIKPVELLIVKPAGNPLADQVATAPPVLVGGSNETVSPCKYVRDDVNEKSGTGKTIVKLKVTESLAPLGFVALIVTSREVASVVGTPVISPVVELIERPAGNVPAETVQVPSPPVLII